MEQIKLAGYVAAPGRNFTTIEEINRQMTLIRDFANRVQFDLVEIIVDIDTDTNPDRPELGNGIVTRFSDYGELPFNYVVVVAPEVISPSIGLQMLAYEGLTVAYDLTFISLAPVPPELYSQLISADRFRERELLVKERRDCAANTTPTVG